MQTMWRALRVVDEVLEIGLVKSWGFVRRRRGILALALAGTVGYLGVGFVTTPSEPLQGGREWQSEGGVAPFTGLTEQWGSYLQVRELLDAEVWTSEQVAQAGRLLEPERVALEKVRHLTERGPVSFARTPHYRRLRDLGRAILLEARWQAEQHRPERSASALVSAMRLARSAVLPTAGKDPLLIDGMIGLAMAGEAGKLGDRLLRSGGLDASLSGGLGKELRAWTEPGLEIQALLRGERQELESLLDQWVATGRLPRFGGDGDSLYGAVARLLLPISEGSRRSFAEVLLRRLDPLCQENLNILENPLRTRSQDERFAPPGVFATLISPFSREAALEVVTSYLAEIVVVDLAKVELRVRDRTRILVSFRARLAEAQLAAREGSLGD